MFTICCWYCCCFEPDENWCSLRLSRQICKGDRKETKYQNGWENTVEKVQTESIYTPIKGMCECKEKMEKEKKTCDSMRCFYSIFSFIYDKIECESKRKSGARPYISSDILIIEQASNKYSAHWMTTQKGVIVFSANVWKCWVFYGMAGGREREKKVCLLVFLFPCCCSYYWRKQKILTIKWCATRCCECDKILLWMFANCFIFSRQCKAAKYFLKWNLS